MSLRTLRLLVLLAATTFTLLAGAQTPAGKSLVQVTDLLQVKQLSGVSIRPNGQEALVTVNNIEPEADSRWEFRYNNQLWLVPLNGKGKARALTGKDNAGQAAWSPDGQQIAFVRNADNRPQIFLLSLGGGEARQLTRFKYGASNPVWSPDGQQIVFTASVSLKDLARDSSLNPGLALPAWPLEKPGFPKNEHLKANAASPNPNGNLAEIRAYLELNAQDRKAKVINKLNFQEEATTTGDLNFTHLFVVDAETGNAPKALTKGFYRYGNPQFSPDGKSLVCTANVDETQHPDKALESQILWINLSNGSSKTLLGAAGKTFSSPKLSPSGKWLAYQQGAVSFVDVPQLYVMPIDGNASSATALPFDRNKSNLEWAPNEDALYFSALSNGGSPIYRMDLKTKKAEALTPADGGVSSFDLQGNQLVFVQTRVENPFELYQSDAWGKNSQAVSRFNADWVGQKQLSFPEKKSFVNEKGLTVEYWVMKPTAYVAGKKYPAILNIHGGPSAMWGPGESSMWHEFQYFCARGYVVVYGNPRGSGGYGADFLRANINDWGTGPSNDVLTYLDLAAKEGFIDTSRMAVTGGSYAGYLVAWIIGHDQRFKAASSQRGVYDLRTFMGEGNAWRLVPNYFGGYPWEEKTKAILERESPINYVANIRTPYLIFHGENDLRTGVIQSEMLYRSLKILGRPVEYVRHPGGTHELTRSGNNRQRIDQMLRTLEFFDRFIAHP